MLLVLVLLAWGSLQDILHRASRQEPSDPEGKRVWESLLRQAAEAQINGRIRMADQASFSNTVGVKWRPNFKLQFFRVSEPVAPTWTGADPKGTDDSFAHTGASEQQQAVWQSIYDWMKGEEKESASALSDGEVTRLSGLISTLETIADEPQRIGSAYGARRASASARSRSLVPILLCCLPACLFPIFSFFLSFFSLSDHGEGVSLLSQRSAVLQRPVQTPRWLRSSTLCAPTRSASTAQACTVSRPQGNQPPQPSCG